MSMTEPAPIKVSVAICTRNRPDTIGQAVESVLANDYPDFTLTVVDQSTTDATKAALQPLVAANRLRYVHMDVAGLSRARNEAIRGAEGAIIAFTDDDCIVPPGWLSAIVRSFAMDQGAALLYGQVFAPEQPMSVTPFLEIPHPERLSRRDGFKVFGMGANFSLRRSLFDAIGGFDECLGAGSSLPGAEDFDFAYRAYRAGFAILLRPEIHVVHYGARARAEWPAMLRAYGAGDGAFFFKHVRCGDIFALWLMMRRLGDQGGRQLVKRLLRRPSDFIYVRAHFAGIRASLRFAVDRKSRLYIRPPGLYQAQGQG